MKFYQFIQEKIFKPYRSRYERKRSQLFYNYLNPGTSDKILDFGGGNGRRMAGLFPDRRNNIYIADIMPQDLEHAKKTFSFETILINESGNIPFEDKFFDITFCNSVIEHATVDKDDIWNIKTNEEFREKSRLRQKKLADEIRRVSKKYMVQTPNKHFIIESHTWFPSIIIYLPRSLQLKFMRFLNKFWIEYCYPDFNLLTIKEMRSLFPEAKVLKEKSLFMTKSIIVIKS